MSKKILVVDDDRSLRDVVSVALTQAGIDVQEASNGAEGLKKFNENEYDLLIIDIMMPEMDGNELCKEIRKASEIPIIFLSSKGEEIDKVVGLELGADDYVTKPFSPRELIVRINNILKRVQKSQSQNENGKKEFRHGYLSLNIETHSISWSKGDEPCDVSLTAIEFSLMRAFIESPGKVFTRDNLLTKLYDFSDFISDRTIDSHIRKIRAKFSSIGANSIIETMHGVGYKLGSCTE